MNFTLTQPLFRLFAVMFATLILTACGDAPEPESKEVVRPVKLMTLVAGDTGRTLEYPGHVSATRAVSLGFEVPGKIIELPITDGLRVKKDQLLARLDPVDYVAARNAAKANLNAAQAAYSRAKRIFDQGAGSQAEVDRALRDIRVAKADMNKASKALDDTILKAPFTGMIARKIADNYENVQAKQAILQLQDISSLELDVNIPEQDVARAKAGLTLDQYTKLLKLEVGVSTIPDRRFPARLISMEAAANAVTRTYLATLAFDNPEDVNVLPGMTAHAILHLPDRAMNKMGFKGFMIPTTATMVDSSGKPYVWRFDPESQQVHRTPVTLGDMSGADVLVTDGLKSGDQIAESGAAYLHEGMKVRPLK